MKLLNLKSEKGFALISVYMVSLVIFAIAGSTYLRTIVEAKEVGREWNRLQARATAEAGIQAALTQIGINVMTGGIAYTGYINTNAIAATNLNSYDGSANVGNFSVNITYPNQADWVVVSATGAASQDDNTPITLEGRVFLDSNFSKYMVYSNTPTVWLGNNLQLGVSDGTNPEGVPSNGVDRNMLYYTGNLAFPGNNVQIYGDVNTQGTINGNGTSTIHGDAYVGSFATNMGGQVTSTGVTGGLTVNDGFGDDVDRNGDGFIDALDAPDHHDLTAAGGGDAHKFETVNPLDINFYATQAAKIPGPNGIDVIRYGGGTPRYFKLEQNGAGKTKIVEYSGANYQNVIGSRILNQKNGIVYVNGDIFVKGQVAGRVTVVSSNNIYYTDHVKYAGGSAYSSSDNSVSFLAKNQHYFLPNDVEVSGIVYGEKAYEAGNLALVASKKLDANYNVVSIAPGEKADGHFRHYGNIVMNGTANTAVYTNDRAYLYDQNIKYYRPPGIPVQPVLRLVREA